jgi:hypothetical protein
MNGNTPKLAIFRRFGEGLWHRGQWAFVGAEMAAKVNLKKLGITNEML